MASRTTEIQEFILKSVPSHPHDLVRFVANKFKITPQAVHKYTAPLLREGRLRKQGTTRSTVYSLPTPAPNSHSSNETRSARRILAQGHWSFPVDEHLNEQEVWDKTLKPNLQSLRENLREIAEYGFTEMVNNVIDHAQAKLLSISYRIDEANLTIHVEDDGIGIFRKIRESLALPTLREAVLELSKGKLTTDHSRHTGEGIFFSSRVFDEYFLFANGLKYVRINADDDEDWILGEEAGGEAGTKVFMSIGLTAGRTREEVFKRFTSPEDFSFSTTHVAVELGLVPGETYVSRSQAKRILSGLNKFRNIVLNFKRVTSVGQGFVDEVFRIFRNAHPEIRIDYINANESVEFMIRRSGPAAP
jgi:hypothetical protein